MYFEKVNPDICDKLVCMKYSDFTTFYDKSYSEDENDDDLKKQYAKIIKYCKNQIKNNYCVKMTYSPSTNTPKGRQFSDGASLQNIWKKFRGILCNGLYIDIDMKNAHPTILLYLCKNNNIKCENLEQYVSNRDFHLTTMAKELETDNDYIKTLFIKSINSNHSVSKFGKKTIKSAFFKNFDEEMKKIQTEIYKLYSKDFDNIPDDNPEGKILNRVLCMHENSILKKVIDYNDSCFIKTGVLCFDGCMIYNNNYDESFLDSYLNSLNEITKEYNIKWSIKKFDTEILNKVNNFDTSDLHLIKEANTSFSNTINLATHMMNTILKNKLVCNYGTFWMNDNNLWSSYSKDEVERQLYKIISDQCYYITIENDKGEPKTILATKEDSYIIKIRRAIMSMVPIDNDLLNTLNKDTSLKLCFRNGYYDFKEKKFFKEYNFKTPVIIERDYTPEYSEDAKNEIYKLVLEPIFGNDEHMIKYYLHKIARSMAGHVSDKKVFLLEGMRNSGKGCLTELLINSFGGYIRATDANNFVFKKTSSDPAKELAWIIGHMFSRICLTHEIKTGDNIFLDGNMIKKFSSGGDRIQARLNHKDEIDFKIQSTLWLNCNDFPECKPSDCLKYMDSFQLKTCFVDINDNEPKINGYTYLPKNDYVKDVLPKKEEIINAFINIIIEAYNTEISKPEKIQKEADLINSDNDYTKLLDLFEFTNKDSDTVYNKTLRNIMTSNNIPFTINKVKKILKNYNCKEWRDRTERGLSGLKLKSSGEIMEETSALDL
jgi:hypothetical protein